MIHVALDTSIYSKKPNLDSPEFRALALLAKTECINLHIPFFVEKEFKSQIENEQYKQLESVTKALEKICKFDRKGPQTDELVRLTQKMVDIKDFLVEERGNAFVEWANELNATKHPLTEGETGDALSAYFEGKLPLKEPNPDFS